MDDEDIKSVVTRYPGERKTKQKNGIRRKSTLLAQQLREDHA
jgi:hypothetical protein